jgi:hypothetical protein
LEKENKQAMLMDKLDKAMRSIQFPLYNKAPSHHSAEQEYIDGAHRALNDLQTAERYFNSITDPDLIEYALYEIEAARRKYEYMMRKLRSGEASWENASETQ